MEHEQSQKWVLYYGTDVIVRIVWEMKGSQIPCGRLSTIHSFLRTHCSTERSVK